MLALITKCLTLHMAQIGSLMVFQFDDTNNLSVTQDGTIRFLGVGLVLLLRDKIVIRRRVKRITEHLYEQLPKKTLLELFFFGRADVVLNGRVEEIRFVGIPGGCHLLLIKQCSVFLYDGILKEHIFSIL